MEIFALRDLIFEIEDSFFLIAYNYKLASDVVKLTFKYMTQTETNYFLYDAKTTIFI